MRIFSADDINIAKGAELIKGGKLVAFPTETVYGLGANAFNAKAVASIFEAKGRPSFNPLISHIAEPDMIRDFALVDERVMFLAKKFWPGPLTFVLKRKEDNPALDLVCAGLSSLRFKTIVRGPGQNFLARNITRSSTRAKSLIISGSAI